MRKKCQSWFIPLLILFAALWVIGKKDTLLATAPLSQQTTPNTLASAPLPVAPPEQIPPLDQFVNAEKLNVRSQPEGKVISTLKRGDRVQVFEKKNDWVRISMDSQPNGYRPKAFVTERAATQLPSRNQSISRNLLCCLFHVSRLMDPPAFVRPAPYV